jgi:putative peptidoglycan lipid II flippase
LLAQHLGKASGIANASAWAAVIISVAGLRLIVPAQWLVPVMAVSVSLGMVVGAVVGWLLLRQSGMAGVGLAKPMLVGLVAAVLAGGLGAVGSRQLGEVDIVVAVLGACLVATVCVLVFVGMLRLLAPSLLTQMWALRRRTAATEVDPA